MKKLYRYYDVQYSAGCDEWGDDLGPGRVGVHLMEFNVIKETKCGVWIQIGETYNTNDYEPEKVLKFVNLKCTKRYALPTKEEAMVSFIARKQSQINILKAQIIRVEKALIEVSDMQKEDNPNKKGLFY